MNQIYHQSKESQLPALWEALCQEVVNIGLPLRAHHYLHDAGIEYVYQLVTKREEEILRIRNLGRISLKVIKEVLKGMGLRLGFSLPVDLRGCATVEEARRILRIALASEAPPDEEEEPWDDEIFASQLPKGWSCLFQRVDDLALTEGALISLDRARVKYVFQLVSKGEEELAGPCALGPEHLEGVRRALAKERLPWGAPLPSEVLPLTRCLLDEPWQSHLPLSPRTGKILLRAGYQTVGELLNATDGRLLRLPFFGRGSLRELRGALENMEERWGGLDNLAKPRLFIVRSLYRRLCCKGLGERPAHTMGLAYQANLADVEALKGPQTLASLALLLPWLLTSGALDREIVVRLQQGLEHQVEVRGEAVAQSLGEAFDRAMGSLTDRERCALELRHLLGRILSEASQVMEVSRERVRQLSESAIRKLQQSCGHQVAPLVLLVQRRLLASGGILHRLDLDDVSGGLDLPGVLLALQLVGQAEGLIIWRQSFLVQKQILDPPRLLKSLAIFLHSQGLTPQAPEVSERCRQGLGLTMADQTLSALVGLAWEMSTAR